MTTITATKAGCWNWKAQLSWWPARLKPTMRAARKEEPGEDAGDEGEAEREDAARGFAGLADESEYLEGDDREDAGHDVEDEAAEEAEAEPVEERRPAACGSGNAGEGG
jgi:hypothetical protein